MKLRKAKLKDSLHLFKLINHFADKGLMLPRSLNGIYENLRDFTVAISENEIIGCVALHVCWEDIAEIRSLAVKEEFQKTGIGAKLVKAAIEEARELEVDKIFTLTCEPSFFEKLGFLLVPKKELPQKIWKDCLDCLKFPDCNEVALVFELSKIDERC